MSEDKGIESVCLLYSENAKVTVEFWEWRHKVMTRFFAVIAASIAMAGWFYQQSELKHWVFVPFFLAFIFSLLSDMMDRVNTKVLRECYRIGSSLEHKLSSDAGIYNAIQDVHYNRASYHRVLRVMYVGTAFIFAVAAILAAVFVK